MQSILSMKSNEVNEVNEPSSPCGTATFVLGPRKVAEHHAAPWRAQWKLDDPTFVSRLGANFQRLRRNFLFEAAETARLFDGRAVARRKA